MNEVTHILRHIRPERVKALSDGFYSEGWYTQAREIDDLGHERDMLLEASKKLEAELSAERMRRLAAEKVVDHAIAHASYAGTRVMAQEYRTQYPRVEEEQ